MDSSAIILSSSEVNHQRAYFLKIEMYYFK